MTTITVQLLTEEMTSLRELSRSLAQNAISPTHREKLIGCGFAAECSGMLTVTPMGHAKLVYETTRACWS
jgi:hypothetical protein